MKRDMDLIRKILLSYEAEPGAQVPSKVAIEGYSEEQIDFHLFLMWEAGLIKASDTRTLRDRYTITPLNITWAGYEFLEACRDEGRWKKAKAIAEKTGGMSLDVLKATLTALATQGMKTLLGM